MALGVREREREKFLFDSQLVWKSESFVSWVGNIYREVRGSRFYALFLLHFSMLGSCLSTKNAARYDMSTKQSHALSIFLHEPTIPTIFKRNFFFFNLPIFVEMN